METVIGSRPVKLQQLTFVGFVFRETCRLTRKPSGNAVETLNRIDFIRCHLFVECPDYLDDDLDQAGFPYREWGTLADQGLSVDWCQSRDELKQQLSGLLVMEGKRLPLTAEEMPVFLGSEACTTTDRKLVIMCLGRYDDQYWNLRTKDLGGVKWGTVYAFILGLVNQFLTWEYPILPVPGQQEVPSEEGDTSDEEDEDDDGELSRDGDSIEDDGGSESDGWESDDY